MLSFVTNATINDESRLKVFIPHVLSVFGDSIDELLIIVDRKPEEGRIKKLHADSLTRKDDSFLSALSLMDKRIRIQECNYDKLQQVSEKWFGESNVNRCQAGTPIFAFLYGIESCKNDYILKSDCDIFFCDNGLMDHLNSHSEIELEQLPRLNDDAIEFSSRAFFVNRKVIEKKLPVKVYQLDLLRRLHRFFLKRSSFFALEQILHKNIKGGRLKANFMSVKNGYTMHIPRREYFNDPQIIHVESLFKSCIIPVAQLNINHDYQPELWK